MHSMNRQYFPLQSPPPPPHTHTHTRILVCLKISRLDSSDLLTAQLVERQTSIHEVVGSNFKNFKFRYL